MTDPNTQLRHGPLTADMVPLLTAGSSVLLWKTASGLHLVALIEVDRGMGGWLAFETLDGQHRAATLAPLLTYIGERGPDGWITAPEGGWAENPVPGMRVDAIFEDGITMPDEIADEVFWPRANAFRPAEALSAHPPATGSGEAGEEQPPCPVCGNEGRTGAGYLTCECPAPIAGRGDLAVAIKALEPFAALVEKFDGALMVEVSLPHPNNPSSIIQPVPFAALVSAAEALRTLTEKGA